MDKVIEILRRFTDGTYNTEGLNLEEQLAWKAKLIDDLYKKKEQERVIWKDKPTERGDYWVSSFCDWHYIYPRILSVIDYDRPDRGLEVQYDGIGKTIPVKTFIKDYLPNAKWMLIKVPEWQHLKQEGL